MKKRLIPILAIFIVLLAFIMVGCRGETIPIERMAVTSLPKLDYFKGETFKLNDAKVTLYYSDGKETTLPLTLEMISDYDPQDVGIHVLTVRYENVYTNIKISISNSPITYIELTQGTLPYKTNYIEDQSLDVDNLFYKVYYETGNPDTFPVTKDMVSGFSPSIFGQQVLTVKHTEAASGRTFSAQYTVTVSKKSIANISINKLPTKELYLIDEKITRESIADGVLFVAYNNGFTEYIDFDKLYDTDEELSAALSYSTEVEKKSEVVTLNYQGKAVIFTIKVLIKDIVACDIVSLPTDYKPQIVGTPLSLVGGKIRVYYNNESVEEFEMTHEKVISAGGYDRNTVGKQTVSLRFSDVPSTFEFEIEVIDMTIESLEILAPVLDNGVMKKYSEAPHGTRVIYYQDSTISLDMWEYRLLRDNGTYSSIFAVDAAMLVGGTAQLTLTEVGDKTLTFVFHAGEVDYDDEVTLSVAAKRLQYITVTPPVSTVYYLGTSVINLDGGTLNAYFNDGSVIENLPLSSYAVDISGFVGSIADYQVVTVTYNSAYGSAYATFTVLVVRQPARIAFDTASTVRTSYILGEDFDATNLSMLVYFEGVATPEIRTSFTEEWRFENTHFDTLGNTSVSVYFSAFGYELSAAIPVVVHNEIVSIELVKLENGDYAAANSLVEIVAGMELQLADYFVRCTLENGTVSYVQAVAAMFNYVRSDRNAGERQLTLTYQGKSITGISLNVLQRNIATLELVSAPAKRYYKADSAADYDLTGMSLRISYTNNTFRIVSAEELVLKGGAVDGYVSYEFGYYEDDDSYAVLSFKVSALDTSLPAGENSQTKTVSIMLESKEVSFDIIIADKVVTSLSWNTANAGEPEVVAPEIKAYQSLGKEWFDFSVDTKFKAVYNDGESYEIITLASVWDEVVLVGFNRESSGAQTISFLYRDILLPTVVRIQPKILVSAVQSADFYIPDVTEGLDLDLVNATMDVKYRHDRPGWTDADNLAETVPVSKEMIVNYNTTLTPRTNFEVQIDYTFNGVTMRITCSINILQKQLTGIGIYTMPKTRFIEREEFDASTGSIILYYNNNTNEIKTMDPSAGESQWVDDFAGDHYFLINKGMFNSEDFSGFAKRYEILIRYTSGSVTCETSYDITVHDRLYITVSFEDCSEYSENDMTYRYTYGEDRTIGYSLWGYERFTDIESELRTKELTALVEGTHYLFKYVNEATGAEYYSWPKNAGTYTIWIIFEANSMFGGNDESVIRVREIAAIHNSLEYTGRKLIIEPRRIQLTANSLSKVYGENVHPFGLSVLAIEYIYGSGGIVGETYRDTDIFGYNDGLSTLGLLKYLCNDSRGNPINTASNAGVYSITPYIDGEANPNYVVTFVSGAYTVIPRAVMVIANPAQKVYGSIDPIFTYTTSGVIGDSESGLLDGDAFVGYLGRLNASVNRNVGVYDIIVGTLQNSNYSIVFKSAKFSITPCEITVKPDALSKVYGMLAPTYNSSAYVTATGGALPNGESIYLTPSFIGTLVYELVDGNNLVFSPSTAAAGTYTIRYTEGGRLTSVNYIINYETNTFTVERRKVVVTPNSNQSVIYGNDFPIITYTTNGIAGNPNSGLLQGDALFGALSRINADVYNAGIYEITAGTLTNDNNKNYDIQFASGINFVIDKRIAQVTVDEASLTRQYNGQVPNQEELSYTTPNAHNDISANISLVFQNPNANVGRYLITLSHTDPNHILSLTERNGYVFTITQKEVTTEFYNIPYGEIINGVYCGSTYTGTPYYIGAMVPDGQRVSSDTVEVSISVATVVEGITPVYQQRTNVINAGVYSVRVDGLSNSNYKLVEPENPNDEYRYTDFKINPMKLRIEILRDTNNLITKQYTGSEIRFSNSLALVGDYYQSTDYRILTTISENPRSVSIDVYPYYIDGDRIRYPRIVRDEGYEIAVTIGNSNYVAELVKKVGNEYQSIELNADGTIARAEDKLKVVKKEVVVTIDGTAVRKVYDGLAPSIPEDMVGLSDVSVTVTFDFIRIMDNEADYTEYNVPSYMENYISNKDTGRFAIVPVTDDPNYNLTISTNSPKIYTIERKRISRFALLDTVKEYDGLMPSLTVSQLTITGYTLEERGNLNWQFLFDVGNDDDFFASDTPYDFTVQFLFPHQNPAKRDKVSVTGGGGVSGVAVDCELVDYNHYLAAVPECSLSHQFRVTKRNVTLKLLTTEEKEGYNWKYYNGLKGADVYDFSNAVNPVDAASSKEKFERAFIIVDSRAYSSSAPIDFENAVPGLTPFANNEAVRIKHMLNGMDGAKTLTELIVGSLSISSPGDTRGGYAIAWSHLSNDNPNFNISLDSSINMTFEIRRRELEYYIDDTSSVYGESILEAARNASGENATELSLFNFTIAESSKKYLAYDESNEANSDYLKYLNSPSNLFSTVAGSVFLLTSGNFAIDVLNDIGVKINTNGWSSAGFYDIVGNDREFYNYSLKFVSNLSKDKFEIKRRELPVLPMRVAENGTDIYVQRVYGTANINDIYFTYTNAPADRDSAEYSYGVGLLPSDSTTAASGFVAPAFNLVGKAASLYNNAGIITDAGAFTMRLDSGDNTNYKFTYGAFSEKNTYLEITKADLRVAVVDSFTKQKSFQAMYGEFPTNYEFSFAGIRSTVDDNINNMFLPMENGATLPAATIDGITFEETTLSDFSMVQINLASLASVDFKRNVKWNGNTVVPHTDLRAAFFTGVSSVTGITIKRLGKNSEGEEAFYDFTYTGTINLADTKLSNYNIIREDSEYTVVQRSLKVSLDEVYDNGMYNILYDESLLEWEAIKESWLVYYYYATENNGIQPENLDMETYLSVVKEVMDDLLAAGDSGVINTAVMFSQLSHQEYLDLLLCKYAQWLIAYENETKEGLYLLSKYTLGAIMGMIDAYNASYPETPIEKRAYYDFGIYRGLTAAEKKKLFDHVTFGEVDVNEAMHDITNADLQWAIDWYYGDMNWILQGNSYEDLYIVYTFLLDDGQTGFDLREVIEYANTYHQSSSKYVTVPTYNESGDMYQEYMTALAIVGETAFYSFVNATSSAEEFLSQPVIVEWLKDADNLANLQRGFNSQADYDSSSAEIKALLLQNWVEGNPMKESYRGIFAKMTEFNMRLVITPPDPEFTTNRAVYSRLSSGEKSLLCEYLLDYEGILSLEGAIRHIVDTQNQDLSGVTRYLRYNNSAGLFAGRYPGFPTVDSSKIEGLILKMTTDVDMEKAFERVSNEDVFAMLSRYLTTDRINTVFSTEVNNYDETEKEAVYQTILEKMMPASYRRRLFTYVYETERLVYGDTLADAFGTSKIGLNYTAAAGTDRTLSPALRIGTEIQTGTGTNYSYIYSANKLNIYRYIVDIGYDLNMPNVILSTADYSDMLLRVTYNDGVIEYVKFSTLIELLETDDNSYIRYFLDFELDDLSAIIADNFEINQEITVKIIEKFFNGQNAGEYEIVNETVSSSFLVRMHEEEDTLLWQSAKKTVDETTLNSGELKRYNAFYSLTAQDEKVVGDKISSNHTYYAAEAYKENNQLLGPLSKITVAEGAFDLIDTRIRLMPKENVDGYYYRLVVNAILNDWKNEVVSAIDIRFMGGVSNMIYVYVDGVSSGYSIPVPKTLDIFDGYTHNIKAYIDRLGSYAYSDAPYEGGNRLIIVIDDCYYYSINLSGHTIPERSAVGFEANNCHLWVADFDLYRQGYKATRAVLGVPYSIVNSNNEISFNAKVYNLAGKSTTLISFSEVKNMVTAYVMDRAAGNDSLSGTFASAGAIKASDITYIYKLDGTEFTGNLTLAAGLYCISAEIYHSGTLVDVYTTYISVSANGSDYNLRQSTESLVSMNSAAVYYGYVPTSGNDLVMNSSGESLTSLELSKNNASAMHNYTHINSTFKLEIPTNYVPSDNDSNTGSEKSKTGWNYPYNLAYIIKTTSNLAANADIRDYSNYENTTYSAVGLYFRCLSDGTFAAKLYIRVPGVDMQVVNIRPSVSWDMSKKVSVDAYFDRLAERMDIVITQGEAIMYAHTFRENIKALIDATSTTARFLVKGAKLSVYALSTGEKTGRYYDFYNPSAGTYIIGQRKTVVEENTRLFISNTTLSEISPNVSGYSYSAKSKRISADNIELLFSARNTNFVQEQDVFGFYLSSTGSLGVTGNSNSGIYIGYRQTSENVYSFSARIYKAGTWYQGQAISTSKNLMEAEETLHTLRFELDRDRTNTARIQGIAGSYFFKDAMNNEISLNDTHPSIAFGYINPVPNALGTYYTDQRYVLDGSTNKVLVSQSVLVNWLNIYADDELVATFAIPYVNKLSAWVEAGGTISDDSYTGTQNYDWLFLPNYYYFGLETKNATMNIYNTVMY